MKKFLQTRYKCDFCGEEHEDKAFMEFHEIICPLNPQNQPCSTCENQILHVGCIHGMDMETVGGNVLCFYYKKGYPQNPVTMLLDADIIKETDPDGKNT